MLFVPPDSHRRRLRFLVMVLGQDPSEMNSPAGHRNCLKLASLKLSMENAALLNTKAASG
jgi:hypothetical protein